MKLNKLKVCQEADNKLRVMSGWTGLRPNILARLGFNLSLAEPMTPKLDSYPEDSDREFNRYTLMGEWDTLFVSLLRQRCKNDGIDLSEENLVNQFKAHLNRGILLLSKRIQSQKDIGRIVEKRSQNLSKFIEI